MGFENFKDINLDYEDERFVKIFKKSNYRNSENSEEDNKYIIHDSDDSDMKIFFKK